VGCLKDAVSGKKTIMCTRPDKAIRELDHRSNDGIDVWLFWNSYTDRVWVAVEDKRSGASLGFEVTAANALAAFHHPYAYANRDHGDHALAA
jgi:hypothetical protein